MDSQAQKHLSPVRKHLQNLTKFTESQCSGIYEEVTFKSPFPTMSGLTHRVLPSWKSWLTKIRRRKAGSQVIYWSRRSRCSTKQPGLLLGRDLNPSQKHWEESEWLLEKFIFYRAFLCFCWSMKYSCGFITYQCTCIFPCYHVSKWKQSAVNNLLLNHQPAFFFKATSSLFIKSHLWLTTS